MTPLERAHSEIDRLNLALRSSRAKHELYKAASLSKVRSLRLQLRDALGLWRYWSDNDITADDDLWADFSNAVIDMLDGKPVDKRWLK